MKKIFIYVFAVFTISSCSLDLEPKNSVTYTNYFKSEADVESLVITMMAKQRYIFVPIDGTVKDIISLECDNEDVVLGGNRFDNLAVGLKSLAPSTYNGKTRQHFFDWKFYYDIIHIANVIIDNEYRFQNINAERAAFWIQQAHFCKAQMYFELARNWGEAPIAPKSEDISKKGKSSQKELLDEAIRCALVAKDLPVHENLMGANNRKLTLRQYASKGTVYTLMANIYAYMGGLYNKQEHWSEAEKYASEVIEGRAGTYALEPDIATMCKNCLGKSRMSNETIFAIEMSSKDYDYSQLTIVRKLYPLLSTITAPHKGNFKDVTEPRFWMYTEARIKRSAVLALYNEVDDDRRDEFWYGLTREEELIKDPDAEEGDVVEPVSIYYSYPNKLKSSDILRNTNTDFGGDLYLGFDVNRVIWRLADLILLRAECRARLNLATAVDDLNTIRHRAGLGDYSGGGDIRREIYKERQRELFGEGHRFNDAVRNGYYSELSPQFGALTASDIEKGALYYPVSEGAFKDNDLMRQNTYWLWRQ